MYLFHDLKYVSFTSELDKHTTDHSVVLLVIVFVALMNEWIFAIIKRQTIWKLQRNLEFVSRLWWPNGREDEWDSSRWWCPLSNWAQSVWNETVKRPKLSSCMLSIKHLFRDVEDGKNDLFFRSLQFVWVSFSAININENFGLLRWNSETRQWLRSRSIGYFPNVSNDHSPLISHAIIPKNFNEFLGKINFLC